MGGVKNFYFFQTEGYDNSLIHTVLIRTVRGILLLEMSRE